jgi:hypothetical protein
MHQTSYQVPATSISLCFIDFQFTACGRTQDGTLTAAKLGGVVIQRPAHTLHSTGPIPGCTGHSETSTHQHTIHWMDACYYYSVGMNLN